MTTIIYKNGVLYADTQRTTADDNKNIISTEEVEKINVFKTFMFAGAGLSDVIDTFKSWFHRVAFKQLGWTINRIYANRKFVESYGNTSIIHCTLNSVEVLDIGYRHLFGYFYLIKLVEIEKYKSDNCWIIFGSGADYFGEENIEDPIDTIEKLSIVDKYTNDIISYYDSKDLA